MKMCMVGIAYSYVLILDVPFYFCIVSFKYLKVEC